MFIEELKRLHEAATEGIDGAGMDLRDFLEDHAPAIIALCEAAQGMSQSESSAEDAQYEAALYKSLAALEDGNG